MSRIVINHATGNPAGEISLDGSKSIANRVLIVSALTPNPGQIKNIPACDDAAFLQEALLHQDKAVHHVKLAGTAGRFLTAYFGVRGGTQVIDADEGLRNRPIQPLIKALNELGCDIESVHGNDKFPVRIGPFKRQKNKDIRISGNVSSQFISALLMVAPVLPEGLNIHIEEGQVSESYIEMTLSVMSYFGVKTEKSGNILSVRPQNYVSRDIVIEGDWSSASYYFGLAALSKKAAIGLKNLFPDSWQGDQKILGVCPYFGIRASFEDDILWIYKDAGATHKMYIEWDFRDCPDLFQTIATASSGLSMHGVFTGLDTLPYKETNRIVAVQNELQKAGVFLSRLPEKFAGKAGKSRFVLEGTYLHPDVSNVFETYSDHRMAMSLAMLGVCGKITVDNPEVVEKSYPTFWQDLEVLGFTIQNQKEGTTET
jgi:3-phosphoshikimate 1-carboxyvinyltransferase